MSALIPAGESGTFRVTVEMLGSMSLDSLEQVDGIIRAEAAVRGLDLFVEEDPISRDLIVSWRPAIAPEIGHGEDGNAQGACRG